MNRSMCGKSKRISISIFDFDFNFRFYFAFRCRFRFWVALDNRAVCRSLWTLTGFVNSVQCTVTTLSGLSTLAAARHNPRNRAAQSMPWTWQKIKKTVGKSFSMAREREKRRGERETESVGSRRWHSIIAYVCVCVGEEDRKCVSSKSKVYFRVSSFRTLYPLPLPHLWGQSILSAQASPPPPPARTVQRTQKSKEQQLRQKSLFKYRNTEIPKRVHNLSNKTRRRQR